jgi:hypothetical protein
MDIVLQSFWPERSQGVKLTTHLYLVPNLIMLADMPALTCPGTTFTFTRKIITVGETESHMAVL